MSLRSKLKGVKPAIDYNNIQLPPTWYCGDDVPLTWKKKELKKMRKKTIKQNYKNGNITKTYYKMLMKNVD